MKSSSLLRVGGKWLCFQRAKPGAFARNKRGRRPAPTLKKCFNILTLLECGSENPAGRKLSKGRLPKHKII
ncbi:MAG: hypothetical protein A3G49_00390 [Candidatus Sungbacteria bacterium RIFCSPLOWO2_12_FULL_41_11]|uniref:Uncharacterized protein n=1 Tax=Candidatus Sungbacteria bacterium RIFCSPLOWO2_12_FULL_41_11 TaxID=1802286 RepID=A0A1G2LMB9_9BACT|nr:MAG: hypothetical protein A3G49_00390 [Candidatus Sungbacteria bacterium RIFCSPLOWO2_12_FULL_41_11]